MGSAISRDGKQPFPTRSIDPSETSMYGFFYATMLLADRTARLEDLTRQFRERRAAMSPSMAVAVLAIVTGIVLGFWLWARVAERREQSRGANRPWRLLWSLARAHGLRGPEIWCLWRLARYQRLTDPARLFLEPERLSAEQAGQIAKPELLESLRVRLFAGLEAAITEEPHSPGCIAAPDGRGS